MLLRLDPCVYIYHVDNDFVAITVWVDDMLLFSTTIKLKMKAINDIESEWQMTSLGTPMKIIGIELTIIPDSIFISSSSYYTSTLSYKKRCLTDAMLSAPR